MTSQINQNKVNKALDLLGMIRKKQQDRINLGSDYVNLYFEDIEGDWLETWGDDEKNSVTNHHNKFEKIFNYLASDDQIAVDFRENLGEESLNNLEIRSYLEKCFELTQNKQIAQARKELEKCLSHQQEERQEMALTRNTSDTNSNNHLRLIRSLLKKFEELLEES